VLGLLYIHHKKRGNLPFIKHKKEDVSAKKKRRRRRRRKLENKVYKYSKFYKMKSALSFPK